MHDTVLKWCENGAEVVAMNLVPKRKFVANTSRTTAISSLDRTIRAAVKVFLASILLKAGQRDSPPLPQA